MNESQKIQDNYKRILDRISTAAITAGRNPNDVQLITVTKGKPLETVQEAVSAGAQILGENYPEEGQIKIQALSNHSDVKWHMIGHIQSRKARIVCEHYHFVHSLDSLKLARRLNRFSIEMDINLPVLLEINISGEPTKYGWPAHKREEWEGLIPELSEISQLPNLNVSGLMTIAPLGSNPEEARPHFRELCELLEYMEHQVPMANWKELSMGMSSDFEPAIMEGATMVRIGSAILGERV